MLVDDLILAVGDVPVNDSDSLVLAINTMPAGEPVTLKLLPPGRDDRADGRARQVPGRRAR